MKYYYFMALLCLATQLFAQAEFRYTPFESVGEIPDDFTRSSTQKYYNEIDGLPDDDNKLIRNDKQQFLLESSFAIDDLLLSGKVLFNDPVSDYITRVASILLKGEPELFEKMRFYAVRSEKVNAFATSNGIVLFNIALLTQLKSEAELAFILAHEIVHFKEQHAQDLFLDDAKEKRGMLKHDDQHFDMNHYSRELELEADAKGFELFRKSGYALAAIDGVFDVLKSSREIFAASAFHKSFFETDYFKFPDEYQLRSVDNVVPKGGESKHLSGTHPGIKQRRAIIAERVRFSLADDGALFQFSAERFYQLRKNAQYELCEYYLREFDFCRSFFDAFVLLNEPDADAFFLKKVIAKSLYGLCKYRNAGKSYLVESRSYEADGGLEQLCYFINNLKNDELNVLALKYCWALKAAFPEDEELLSITAELFQEMVDHHYDSEDAFCRNYSLSERQLESGGEPLESMASLAEGESDFIRYAFVDFFKDKSFVNQFRACSERKIQIAQQYVFEEDTFDKQEEKHHEKNKKKLQAKGYALGQQKVLVVNPYYMKLDFRSEDPEPDHLASEAAQKKLDKLIYENAVLSGVEATLLSMDNLERGDAGKYNDLSSLIDWFNYKTKADDLKLRAFNQNQINKIADKYETDYFLWLGIISGKTRKNMKQIRPLFPVNPLCTLLRLPVPARESVIFTLVFNARTGETEMVKLDRFNLKGTDDLLNAHLYDLFSRISNY